MTTPGHRHRHDSRHEPPHDCPVCGDTLIVTRLGCDSCGTELSGRFAGSPYSAMDLQDRAILTVFLTSRGNMREVAKWLDVSYPTARQRFSEFLTRLGLSPTEPTAEESTAADAASGAADHTPGHTSEHTSEHTPGHTSDHTPGHTSERAPGAQSAGPTPRPEREEILRRLANGDIDLEQATDMLGRL